MKIFTMGFITVVVAAAYFFLGVAGADASTQGRSHSFLGRPEERRLATQQWCIAKPNLGNSSYQGALDWVCGPLSGQGQVNCGPINSGPCSLPDTYQSRASWAFNVYYQTHGQTAQSCDFQGTAVITTTDPSTSTCPYSAVSNATTSSSTNGTSGAMGNHMIHSSPLSLLSALVSVIACLLTA